MNCSKERGCIGKTKMGRNYKLYSERLAKKHGKQYGVYVCPHCGNHHTTTKLGKKDQYPDLIYITTGECV